MAESCSRILQEHPLFVILHDITQGDRDEEIFNDYMHDFVHSVYNPGTHEEHLVSINKSSVYMIKTLSGKERSCKLLRESK